MIKHTPTKIIFTCLISSASITLHADPSNRRNILPGSRASSMGGAYTALSDDASGSWYNPGGVGFAKTGDIVISANAFTKSRRSVSGAIGGNDVAESSTSIYPAFAGGTAGLGPFRFGYSFFTSDHENIDESFRYNVAAANGVSAYTYSRRLLATNDLLHAGGSIGLKLGNNISIGVGEFYYRRTRQAALIESSVFASGANFDSNIRQSTLNEGTLTTAGVIAKFSALSFGLSARIPKRLADSTLLETSQMTYTGTKQDRAESSSKPHAYDELTAPELNVGIALSPAPWFTLSTDYSQTQAEASPHRDSDGISSRSTSNFATGIEIIGGPLVLRGGIFTNNSLVAEPSSAQLGQPAWINYKGASGSIGWMSKSSESSLGVVRQIGSGKEHSVSGSSAVYAIDAESTTYLITSRYTIP